MNNNNWWLPYLEWDSGEDQRANGINLRMINDKTRNMFYKNAIGKECKNQICVDVGAGNGILTFLAITQGAKHVYCFEPDIYTYNLLKQMAIDLGFIDKITLINQVFKFSNFDSYNWCSGKPNVIFHELLNHRLFNDHRGWLCNAFDCEIDNAVVIPGKYGCEIFSTTINKKLFEKLTLKTLESKISFTYKAAQADIVETGVSTKFDAALQKHRNNFLNLPYKEILLPSSELKALLARKLEFIGKIEFDLNKEKQFPNCFSLNLEPSDNHKIVLLNFYIGHQNSYLKFDSQTNSHFGDGIFYATMPNISTLNIDTTKGAVWFE